MEVRRIRPGEHAAAGDVCVAAYEPLLTGAEDDYRDRLRDVATRDAQAEVLELRGQHRARFAVLVANEYVMAFRHG